MIQKKPPDDKTPAVEQMPFLWLVNLLFFDDKCIKMLKKILMQINLFIPIHNHLYVGTVHRK